MKPIGSPTARRADPTVCCAVSAFGAVETDDQGVAALRQSPAPPEGVSLPPNFLKHSDEQTVVGLAAVFQAIRNHGLMDETFTDWAVLAAPRFFGRAILAAALRRFALEGAWGVSPHLIPHRSQHSLSGTVSQALATHGPNVGVGGGASSAVEAALVTATFITRADVPGLWLVLTGWDPEPTLSEPSPTSRNGHSSSATSKCKGVALALRAQDARGTGMMLRICPPARRGPAKGTGDRSSDLALFTVEGLLEAVLRPSSARTAWRLGTSGRVELDGFAREAGDLA